MSWRERKDEEEKRKRINPFDMFNNEDFFNNVFFSDIMKEIEDIMRNMDENNPNITRQNFGPYIRGYSITIGPDGKPKVKQFRNMNPNIEKSIQPEIDNNNSQEPLIDVFIENDSVKIIAEMPGVNKEDIQVTATDSKVKIVAQYGSKEYKTEKELTVKIKPKTATSKYNNGILEIKFDRQEPSDEEVFDVKID
jgi:HSP20 family protein